MQRPHVLPRDVPMAGTGTVPPGSHPGQGRTRRRWTLSERLAVVYGLVSVLILLCAGAFAWWQAGVLSERNEDLALAETRRLAERLGSTLAQARQGLSVLAVSDASARGADGCRSLLNAAHMTMEAAVRHLFVVDDNRRAICATLPQVLGREIAGPVVRTAELTGRPVTGAIDEAGAGLGPVIAVGHPVLRNGLHAGVVLALVSIEDLRDAAAQHLPEIEGLRAWVLDASGASTSLVGPQAPLPTLPDALHASFVAPRPLEAGVAAIRGEFLVEARVTEDLVLVAAIPEDVIRAGAPVEVALPALILAAILLAGLGALFWSVQRFAVAPLEAAMRRLETDGGPHGAEAVEDGAADVVEFIRRLGASRAMRDEAIRLRDMLLQEAHHRIKNHLALVASFLRLQERQLSDHAALQALRAAQGRMVAIALTYELLHDRPGQYVALDQMLERFARALAARDMAEGNATQVETDLRPIEVVADVAVKVALVVNELTTNALKYAFAGRPPGRVGIVLRPAEGEGFVLEVSDDGVGMPEEPRRGLGLTVVDNVLRGIDASLERLPGPGTRYRIAWTPHGAARPAGGGAAPAAT